MEFEATADNKRVSGFVLRHFAQIQPYSLTSDTLRTLSEMPKPALKEVENEN